MSEIFIAKIAVKLIFATIAAIWASLKGRNAFLWGLAGFVFSVFTLIVLAFMPALCAQCGEVRRARAGCVCGPRRRPGKACAL